MTINTPKADKLLADVARLVHGAMVHAISEFKGEPQPWQNGNSTAESYARRVAGEVLEAAAPRMTEDSRSATFC